LIDLPTSLSGVHVRYRSVKPPSAQCRAADRTDRGSGCAHRGASGDFFMATDTTRWLFAPELSIVAAVALGLRNGQVPSAA
jgi:hypothetical protein